MRVLLLSRNRVVQELVKLGLRGLDAVELEIPEPRSLPRYDRYDLVFEEDHYAEELRALGLEHLLASRRILLGEMVEPAEKEFYDRIIPKPFLPEDIREAVLHTEEEAEAFDEEVPLNSFAGIEEETETEVLDREEILRIRRLLEGEMESEASSEPEETVGRRDSYDFEEFLDLLERCKVKKLRQLLQGSRIHLTIEFPEEER
ncbi:hypothetical protein [Nitratifractor salsuginis]|uniref:Uncharacterized protein n=1 Tax=Nitratifractor salsuginis (strain DSM 16511 / JCM 12458 / E9I37-1) TaxID=749222 RepID=E6WYZ9_NITSE|nr:hypothetical protein [Nitratifractor salsuginis]ADV45449.1 hypothetical protein Nitsa_0176 [Nitratifractor salsuginis DSM 16511]